MPLPRYMHLDVFAATRGGGNHLGVVCDGQGWSDAQMQRFARWNNLVEMTFLLPPTEPRASYKVRIFTPQKEIPFAGHPSIGSAHAALEAGLAKPEDGALWQECGAGVLPIRVHGSGPTRTLLLKSPPARVIDAPTSSQPLLQAALTGVDTGTLAPALVDGGRRWWVVECANEAALRRWQPDHAAVRALGLGSESMGICAFARNQASGYQLAVRALAGGAGIDEDPASGAANGLLAAYLVHAEPQGSLAGGYAVSQGREIGHDAMLQVRIEAGDIWVGGRTHTIIDGQLDWPDQATADVDRD